MNNYMLGHLKQLIGGNIIGLCEDKESDIQGLVVNKGGKIIHVWILCDAEGNGAGHLDIEEQ